MTKHRSQVASQATTQALELPSLLALCAQFGATDVGRSRILALEPLTKRSEVEHRQALVRDTWKVLKDGALVPSQEEALLPLLMGLGDRQPTVAGLQLLQLATVLGITRQAAIRVASSDLEIPKPTFAGMAGFAFFWALVVLMIWFVFWMSGWGA